MATKENSWEFQGFTQPYSRRCRSHHSYVFTMPPFSVGWETASLCLSSGWPSKSFIRWMQMRHVSCQEKEKFHERNSQKASTHSTTADAKVKCHLCEGTHKVKTCKTCKETTVKGRWEITPKNKLCYRCLGPGHLGKACQGSNR